MNREDALRLARHMGVMTRWAQAQKDPRPRMFAEVDLDGVQRRGLSREGMAALVLEHRNAALALAKREGVAALADEIEALTSGVSFVRSLVSMYRLGADALGFDERSR